MFMRWNGDLGSLSSQMISCLAGHFVIVAAFDVGVSVIITFFDPLVFVFVAFEDMLF